MLKLLNKITGHVFILPDEEALKIKEQDRAQEFQILDAGYQEEKEEVVTPKTVEELVLRSEKRKEEIEEEDVEKVVIKEKKVNPKMPVITEDTLNLDKMTKLELVGVANRLGLEANHNERKADIIAKIQSTGVLK